MIQYIAAKKIEPGDLDAPRGITNPIFENSPLESMSGVDFLGDFLPRFVGLAFVIGAIVFFFIMIIGAIQWTSSGGDKTALEGARGKITNAIVGIVILFSLFALLKIIESFFGIDILTLDIGPLVIE